MTRNAHLPRALLSGPFTLEEAKQAGLDRWHLRGASWTRLGPSIYIHAGLQADPMHRLRAAKRRLPADAAFSGLTAAWLHGLDVEPCNPIQATVPVSAGVSARAGMEVRRSTFEKTDLVNAKGFRVTSIVRTVGEVCCRLSLVEAVVVADMALNRRLVRLDQLASWAAANPGQRGARTFRRALGYADRGAASPMETRLRMLLILAGLPRPRTQVEIRDRWGRVIGRPDLYYEEYKLGIEYDGGLHRDMLAEDNRRQNRLLKAGVRLLRFTAGDVLGNPDRVMEEVRSMLHSLSAKQPNAGARA